MATTLGQNNPFRYRGYYYDTETGLYYLQTRYYDASVCRFISADTYFTTGQGIVGSNMYAYCLSNPLTLSDDCGTISDKNFNMAGNGNGSGKKKLVPKPATPPIVTPNPAGYSNSGTKKRVEAGPTPIPNINHVVSTSSVAYKLINSLEFELAGGFGLGASVGGAGLGGKLLARSDVLVLSLNKNGFDIGRRESIEAGASWFIVSSTYYR